MLCLIYRPSTLCLLFGRSARTISPNRDQHAKCALSASTGTVTIARCDLFKDRHVAGGRIGRSQHQGHRVARVFSRTPGRSAREISYQGQLKHVPDCGIHGLW